MARIKSQDTKPEMKVRRALWAAGYRYRVHDKTLPGSPDLAIKRLKAAIFVHGCFWHAHEGCPGFRPPKSRQEYWSAKLARNMARDKKVKEELEAEGWNVLVIWECGLKEPGWLESVLASLEELAKRPGGPSGPASVPY
jgi:DNA mismatch endonuclease (patch repair protein)